MNHVSTEQRRAMKSPRLEKKSKKSNTLHTSCNLTACISAQSLLYCLMRSSVTTVGKRGREISPSCFCHSQLILSCPPPLYSSFFLVAHRIWPGPVFSTMMFSRQSRSDPAKTLCLPPFELVLPLFFALFLCYYICLFLFCFF